MLRSIISTIFCIVLYGNLSAQQFNFNYTGEKQGIPIDQTLHIDQDPDGYLWLGTDRGLYRYDGSAFLNVDELFKSSESLGTKMISALRVVSDSTLYVSRYGKLFLFNYRTGMVKEVHSPVKPDGSPYAFYKLVITPGGTALAVSLDGHIVKLNGHKALPLTSFHGILGPHFQPEVKDAICDKSGNLWLSTSIALIRYDFRSNGKPRIYFPHTESTRLLVTDKKEILVSLYGKGVYILEPGQDQFRKLDFKVGAEDFSVDREEPGNSISSFIEDRLGGIWLSTFNNQLYYLDPRHSSARNFSELYYKAGAIFIPQHMFRDRHKDIWFATRKGIMQVKYSASLFGTGLYNPNHFFDPSESISIKAFFQFDPSKVLISTFRGFYMMDLNSGKTESYVSYVSYNGDVYLKDTPVVNDFYRDSVTGRVWLASETSAFLELIRLDTVSRKIYFVERFPDIFRPKELYTLFHDTAGKRILLGGRGLFSYFLPTGKVSQLPLGASKVYKIVPDTLNRFFLCTDNGLFYWDGKSFLPCIDELRGTITYSAYRNESGTLWISTLQGIYAYAASDKSLRHYTTRNGLASDYTADVRPGKNGTIWIVTSRGLSKYYPKENRFHNYTTDDGLTNNDLNTESWLTLRDGSALVGSINGFNHVDLGAGKAKKSRMYKLFIQNYSVYNSENYTTITQHLTAKKQARARIPYAERSLEFNFQALAFDPGHAQQYRYILEGFDRDWQRSSRAIPARYSNLPPGEYTFRVKHTLDGGRWIHCENPFTFIIPPPFYQSWWFISLLVLSVFAIVYSLYRYRLQSVVKMEKMRNRIASDLHDELGGLVTGIALSADLMEFETEESKERQRKKILMLSREAIGKLSDVVWSVNAGNDNFGSLKDRIQEALENLLGSLSLEYEFATEGIADTTVVPADIRQNVYLICKEAISNFLKHSNGNRLQIKMTNNSDGFRLTITDNGTVFKETRKTGHGLSSIQARVNQLGGVVFIRRDAGGFSIDIKLNMRL